jgi:hypothetical protein
MSPLGDSLIRNSTFFCSDSNKRLSLATETTLRRFIKQRPRSMRTEGSPCLIKELRMSNLIGAALGALIDRRDGDSGIKGAVAGSLTERVVTLAIPFIATAAIGWVIQHYWFLPASKIGKPPE